MAKIKERGGPVDDRYEQGDEREWPPEESSERRFKDAGAVEELNRALLPAALCAVSYAKSCWAFDVAGGALDPAAWMDEASFSRDSASLARALMVAELCSPLSAKDLGLKAGAAGASFERGVWRKGDLGSALCCLAEGVDGALELHLCVRGTEPENHPGKLRSAFQTLAGYFAWTYPRIEKHAGLFGPLADAVRDYAANPANGVGRIVVSGHSLGASAAESLLPRLRAPGVGLEMFGFGSPGTGSGWLAPVLGLGRGALAVGSGAARLGLGAAAGALSLAAKAAEAGGGSLSGFSAMARGAAERLRPAAVEPRAAEAVEITQFRHPNDPVPKLGSLIYATAGAIRESLSPLDFARREAGGKIEAKGFAAHSMTRYASAAEFMLEQAWEELRPGAPPPKRLEQMTRSRMEAARLEASVPAGEHNERVRRARQSNLERLEKANASDPAIAWAKALGEPLDVAERVKVKRSIRKFHAALTAQDRLGEPMIQGPCSLTGRGKPPGPG